MIPQNHLFFPSAEVGVDGETVFEYTECDEPVTSLNLHLLLTFMWCLELSKGQNIISLK